MAENGREILDQPKPSVDKDLRVRNLKDRQNEERQRKLEEIKAQALAAQRFKEQKEQERRRRLEDLRQKDDVRRIQVEERKKAINDAERDRLEFIIKRNHVREQRMESKKKNERSNVVFAFGSSTPRMLEPADMAVSFWGARRATSIQNIASSTNSSSSLTRRQSERDLDIGNKKRATSATGLERTTTENNGSVVPAGCVSGYLGRRRTDLVPTVPTRDPSFHSSRKSLNHSPGRAYSMTRLDQLARPRRRHDLPPLAEANPLEPRPLSSSRVSSSMSHLAVSKSRGDISKVDSRSMHHLAGDAVFAVPRTTRTTQLREQKLHAPSHYSDASSRPSSSLSQQSTTSAASSASVRHRLAAAPRKPRPASIAVTGVTHDFKNDTAKPPLPRARRTTVGKQSDRAEKAGPPKSKVKSPTDEAGRAGASRPVKNAGQVVSKDENQQKPPDIAPVIAPVVEKKLEDKEKREESVPAAVANVKDDPKEENVPESKQSDIELVSGSMVVDKVDNVEDNVEEEIKKESGEVERQVVTEMETAEMITDAQREEKITEKSQMVTGPEQEMNEVCKAEIMETSENNDNNSINEMTSSMTKIRITTEEEAKAALAERRRLIREEAERQAEMERLRIEAEAKAEIERQQKEEEQIRQLIELQRQTEQERLQEAIRETQKREEEERLRREEEQRLKVLKEESDKKAKEEAEKQKAELQERLKNEEKEREARRKRVEAIMLRTRGKNNANLPSQQSTDDKHNENKSEENKDNESKMNGTKIVEQQENGTTNSSKDADIVDNIIPSEVVKNANTVTIETMNSSDSLNSNNSWRGSQQYGNFVCNNNS